MRSWRGTRPRRHRLVGQPRGAPVRGGTGGVEGGVLSLGLGRARRPRSAVPPRAGLRTDRSGIRSGLPRGGPSGGLRREIMSEQVATVENDCSVSMLGANLLVVV